MRLNVAIKGYKVGYSNMQNKQLAFGALLSYGAIIVNVLVTIFYTPWMVAKIGQANYGLYTLAISVIGMFMMDFGLSSAVARFVSKYNAEQDYERSNQFLSAAFTLYIVIDVLMLLFLSGIFLCLGNIYRGLTADELALFKTLFIIVAGFNLIAFPMTPLSGILNAYEQFAVAKTCDLINKVLSVLLVVVVLCFSDSVTTMVLANTTAGIITILIRIFAVKVTTPVQSSLKKVNRAIYKDIFSFSIWTTIIGIAQRITYNFAPSILAITSGSIAVAIYAPASSIGSYFYMIAAATNGLFLPRISRMIAAQKEDELLSLMVAVGRYQTVILGLVVAGFLCVGDDFLLLWMGEEFLKSYPCVVLIMLPAFFEYSQQIGNTAIVAKNYVKWQAMQLTITSALGCVMAFALSAVWGATGVCTAICVTGLANVVGYNYIHQKRLGIQIFSFYRRCYGSMMFPIVASVVVARWIMEKINKLGILWLVCKGFLVVFIYIAFIWFLGLNSNEKKMILKFLEKHAKRKGG